MGRAGHAPADDAAGEGVNDEGHVGEALPGCDIGKVRHPQTVRPWRLELPLHAIERTRRGTGRGSWSARCGCALRRAGPSAASAAPPYSGPPRCLRARVAATPCAHHRRGSSPRTRGESWRSAPCRAAHGRTPSSGPTAASHVHGRWTGQSAAHCRSARPRRWRGDRRRRRSRLEPAVELRLRKIRARLAQVSLACRSSRSRAPTRNPFALVRGDARTLARCRAGLAAPTIAASPPCTPSCPRSSRSPPTPRRARRDAPEPSARPAAAPQAKTSSSAVVPSWLHPLKGWSLRQTRSGSSPSRLIWASPLASRDYPQHQSARTPQRRDQASQRRGWHLSQRGCRHPSYWSPAARTE